MSGRKIIAILVTLVIVSALCAAPAFARSVNFKEAGIATWVFLLIALTVILLQMVPAAILIFAFIGAAVTSRSRREKIPEPELVLHWSKPVEEPKQETKKGKDGSDQPIDEVDTTEAEVEDPVEEGAGAEA